MFVLVQVSSMKISLLASSVADSRAIPPELCDVRRSCSRPSDFFERQAKHLQRVPDQLTLAATCASPTATSAVRDRVSLVAMYAHRA